MNEEEVFKAGWEAGYNAKYKKIDEEALYEDRDIATLHYLKGWVADFLDIRVI